MRSVILIAGAWIALAIPLCATAQFRNAHWFLGDGVHLEFVPGVPVTVQPPSGLVTVDGQSVVSDPQGHLLFIAGHDSLYNA